MGGCRRTTTRSAVSGASRCNDARGAGGCGRGRGAGGCREQREREGPWGKGRDGCGHCWARRLRLWGDRRDEQRRGAGGGFSRYGPKEASGWVTRASGSRTTRRRGGLPSGVRRWARDIRARVLQGTHGERGWRDWGARAGRREGPPSCMGRERLERLGGEETWHAALTRRIRGASST